MDLVQFRAGELALSTDMNHNFAYLDSKILELSESLSGRIAGLSSQIATLMSNMQEFLSYNSEFVPTGGIVLFMGNTVPDNYLECDGSEVSKTDYADLYSVLGDRYTSSDITKFKLPRFVDIAGQNSGMSNNNFKFIIKC